MREQEHHIQDAMELLTVARLQEMAERAGRARTADSASKFEDFRAYASARGLTDADFTSGDYAAYRLSLDKHLPTFFGRLLIHYGNERLDFVNVEVEYRNSGMKGDFEIRPEQSENLSVSLKNYRNNADRPQFNAQTFNSFALSFLFPKGGKVGYFLGPRRTGDHAYSVPFQGSNKEARDNALRAAGREELVPIFHELDDFQTLIRDTFVTSPDWEFLDEEKFDPIRKKLGLDGAATMKRFLDSLPAALIKERVLVMAGLDGSEAILVMDPFVMAESVTSLSPLRTLYTAVKEDKCKVVVSLRGQSIIFQLLVEGRQLVSVQVPHTINKNGAWLDNESYRGGKFHPKEKRVLDYLQRRPLKSKQISTSINTYVDLRSAGIFVEYGAAG